MRNTIFGLAALAAVGCSGKEMPKCYSALPCGDTRQTAAEDGKVSYAHRRAEHGTLKLAVIAEEAGKRVKVISWIRDDYKTQQGGCRYECFSERIRIENRGNEILLVDLECNGIVDRFFNLVLNLSVHRSQIQNPASVDEMFDSFKNKLVGRAFDFEVEIAQWEKARGCSE